MALITSEKQLLLVAYCDEKDIGTSGLSLCRKVGWDSIDLEHTADCTPAQGKSIQGYQKKDGNALHITMIEIPLFGEVFPGIVVEISLTEVNIVPMCNIPGPQISG